MEREMDEEDHSQRPKLVTYYQLALRPNLNVKSRDSKELALLCRALDMLREGRLDAMADLLIQTRLGDSEALGDQCRGGGHYSRTREKEKANGMPGPSKRARKARCKEGPRGAA